MARLMFAKFAAGILSLLFVAGTCAPQKVPKYHDDLSSFSPEESWWEAENHEGILMDMLTSWDRPCDVHCIDMFGASGMIAKAWSKKGYSSLIFDILHDPKHDMCVRSGCRAFMHMASRLVPGGVIVGGPPCSLFVWISSSVHKRTRQLPLGDETNFKVRMANRLTRNMATCLRVLHSCRKNWYLIIEQPSTSRMFHLEWMLGLTVALCLINVTTWQGLFGGCLLKCTHLTSNLPSIDQLSRTLTKDKRQKFNQKMKEKRAKMKKKPVYYKKDARGKVSGGKDLQQTATYPARMCTAIFKAWFSIYVKDHLEKQSLASQ